SRSFLPSLLFNRAPTTDIYPLSLHVALPIYLGVNGGTKTARYALSLSYLNQKGMFQSSDQFDYETNLRQQRYLINSSIDVEVTKDRKSTRLNSSHVKISYAVFCLKKKRKQIR